MLSAADVDWLSESDVLTDLDTDSETDAETDTACD